MKGHLSTCLLAFLHANPHRALNGRNNSSERYTCEKVSVNRHTRERHGELAPTSYYHPKHNLENGQLVHPKATRAGATCCMIFVAEVRTCTLLLSLLTAAASMAAVTTPKADLRYVSPAASDAANQVANPVAYPRNLYPEIEPFETGYLDVGNHKLYYDLSGNPNGVPCIFLHGGPGAGCSPRSRRFFDPAYYKIVILDQRGSGKSIPNAADDLDGSLVENTTPALVHDIDLLRAKLGIERWGVVLGGSWGSTLALAYAQAHPDRCSNLLLRGVFLFGPDEVEYLFCNGGTFGQNPGAWSKYVQYLEDTSSNWAVEKTNLLGAYWTRLTSSDTAVRSAAAAAFVGYELSISKTYTDPAVLEVG